MKSKYAIMILVLLCVLALDQATKQWVHSSLHLYERVSIVPNYFHLTYIRNSGAAFGLFSSRAESFRMPFFVSITIMAILFIAYFFYKARPDQRLLVLALGLVLSGALGNLIDRLRLGEVIDFIDVHWRHLHWPAFNVADIAICVGVGLLGIEMLFLDKGETSQES